MSMWEDLANDYAYEMYSKKKHGIWTMRDGSEIDVKDMTASHIKNCMRMVGEKSEWYKIFDDELKRRESVKEDWDDEIDETRTWACLLH